MSRRWIIAVAAFGALACGRSGLDVTEIQVPATGASADPALALEPGTGDWLMTWVSGDAVWFSRSADQGTTWREPARVTGTPHDVHPHGESSPRLVVSPRGVLAAVWTNSVDVQGRRWPATNIRFSRSLDGGRTWSRAVTLNDDTAAAPGGHLFHGAAWAGDSTLLVAWMDERGGAGTGAPSGDVTEEGPHPGHHPETAVEEPDATIYLARSSNGGARWAANRPLWSAACPCCRVSLARGPDGAVVAGWRKHFPGSVRDPVIAPVSAESARAETRVAADAWVYPGCPHTGPGVTVDGRGTTHVVWFTGKADDPGVYYARRAGDSAGFTAPVEVIAGRITAHPRVAALPDGGAIIATDIDAKGAAKLVLARISPQGRLLGRRDVADALGADHPDMLALPDSTVLVAWTEKEALRLARVQP